MEFLRGKDLEEIIKQRKVLEIDEVVSISVKIADALDYLHKKNLVHRDIKSANIFIAENNRPVLMDFGIALVSHKTKLTQAGTIMGTPEYMSPEQAEGKKVDGRSDIYSLGIVMYEALTGNVPFKSTNPLTVIRMILDDTPVNPQKNNPKIPLWLEEIILKTLEKKPENRFQNGSVLSQSLHQKKNLEGEFLERNSREIIKLDISRTSDEGKTVRLEKQSLEGDGKKKTEIKKRGIPIALPLITLLIVIIVGGYLLFFQNSSDKIIDENRIQDQNIENQSSISDDPDKSIDNVSEQIDDSTGREEGIIDTDDLDYNSSIDATTTVPGTIIEEMDQKQAKIRKLEADLSKAIADEAEAKRKYDHAQRMRERDLLSPGDLNKAKEVYEAASNKVNSIRRELNKLK
jgi:serine/threonine protein kinase